jgi:hypothetical protein
LWLLRNLGYGCKKNLGYGWPLLLLLLLLLTAFVVVRKPNLPKIIVVAVV